MTAWHPLLRPVGRLVIAALLLHNVAPLVQAAQLPGGVISVSV
jgi:hypothetical protein